MKRLFIPYDLSVKLKQLGFNQKCFDVYSDTKSKRLLNSTSPRDRTPKILFQQAFDFFRENKGYYGDIYRVGTQYKCVIENMITGTSWDSIDKPMEYEEARLECLKKLVETVENNK